MTDVIPTSIFICLQMKQKMDPVLKNQNFQLPDDWLDTDLKDASDDSVDHFDESVDVLDDSVDDLEDKVNVLEDDVAELCILSAISWSL